MKSTIYEDELLKKYFNRNGGIIYTEVRVGQGCIKKYPDGSAPRRINAVRVSSVKNKLIPFTKRVMPDFEKVIHNHKVEIIEIERKLNRLVIGQVIVGAKPVKSWLFPLECRIWHVRLGTLIHSVWNGRWKSSPYQTYPLVRSM